MDKLRAMITGVHGYVPEYRLTNKELEKLVETNDEWIVSRTGIKERRILKGEDQGTSVLGAEAVKGLLEKTGIDPLDVDLIICATVTPDMPFPATANIIADLVGAKNSYSFDIGAACSGFLFALQMGSQFIQTGTHKKVIVVGADKMSSIVDYTDRATCILFGDGAGAVMLEPTTEDLGIMDAILKSDGSGTPYLHMKAGGSRRPATPETLAAKEHFAFQEGSTVFRFAVTNMADVSAEIMQKNNLTGDDVAWLVPHQANLRIINATANRMGIGSDKVMMNIEKYGNTTAATIPLCLWDYEKQLKKGDNLILAAFGGGFTWGSIFVKWAYEPK
ncbi:3-oxoacyl-[acyl-carrier-protein] synthase-3 [Algoriphagus ratkowskyi]|uniref:Beta-ketoacyl-[acyl-carrier-protein] synthase III n=1 Tax=Algoriphagus ratkowskyi TaxID=57028 RepID=A0A2W7R3N1_9BACT|nr:beta-ketoacyl-ACP synthase III [Algoriphagus ratkowskyi]PZX53826.1 3-oxoacyl-[acyl-carrier-protein] synthase-3 [Algoriphagus ratkowskyi]TXD76769.1 ketoacyl-ACP synthase III [Algoriphagus ratkowskyi]